MGYVIRSVARTVELGAIPLAVALMLGAIAYARETLPMKIGLSVLSLFLMLIVSAGAIVLSMLVFGIPGDF